MSLVYLERRGSHVRSCIAQIRMLCVELRKTYIKLPKIVICTAPKLVEKPSSNASEWTQHRQNKARVTNQKEEFFVIMPAINAGIFPILSQSQRALCSQAR